MAETNSTWAEWLQARLDERGWKQADLVHHSGGYVKRDRMSKWLGGVDMPSHRLAIVVANTLGVDRKEALQAAGFSPIEVEFGAAIARADDARADDVVLRRTPDSILLKELSRRALERERNRGGGDGVD